MGNQKAGAWALILGALSYVLLMVAHPTHASAPVDGALSLNAMVHGLSLVAQPVLLFGFWVLTRYLGDRPFAQLALCFCASSATATVIAATLSGFVIPDIIAAAHPAPGAHSPGPVDPHTLQPLANLAVWFNRAFAAVHMSLFAIAMLLWSLAWTGKGGMNWAVRIVGFVVAAGVLALAVTDTMTLEAQHGALLLTLAEMLWTLLAAAVLLTAKRGD